MGVVLHQHALRILNIHLIVGGRQQGSEGVAGDRRDVEHISPDHILLQIVVQHAAGEAEFSGEVEIDADGAAITRRARDDEVVERDRMSEDAGLADVDKASGAGMSGGDGAVPDRHRTAAIMANLNFAARALYARAAARTGEAQAGAVQIDGDGRGDLQGLTRYACDISIGQLQDTVGGAVDGRLKRFGIVGDRVAFGAGCCDRAHRFRGDGGRVGLAQVTHARDGSAARVYLHYQLRIGGNRGRRYRYSRSGS